MPVSFRVTAAPKFPQGTVLGAYLRREWSGPDPVAGDKPRAVSASSSSPVANGFATFTGLEGSTAYYAGAEVNGEWRWSSFTTEAAVAGSAEGVSLAEAEALIAAAKAEVLTSLAGYVPLIEALSLRVVTGNITLVEYSAAQVHVLAMKANATITLPKVIAGTSITVVTGQDGPGSRVPTWHSPTGAVRWPGGVVPTASVTANAVDIWNFACVDATDWSGAVPMLDMK